MVEQRGALLLHHAPVATRRRSRATSATSSSRRRRTTTRCTPSCSSLRKTWCALAKKYAKDPSWGETAARPATSPRGRPCAFDKLAFSLDQQGRRMRRSNATQYGWFVLEPLDAGQAAASDPGSRRRRRSSRRSSDEEEPGDRPTGSPTTKGFCTAQIKYQVRLCAEPRPLHASTTTNATPPASDPGVASPTRWSSSRS